METYEQSRSFTDRIHLNVAVPQVYSLFGWTQNNVNAEKAREKDIQMAVDYEVSDPEGKVILLQERFRRNKYACYNDFTLRYERRFSRREGQKKSEYYKLNNSLEKEKEDFFLLYGILNPEETSFTKYLLADLRALYGYIEEDRIRGDEDIKKAVFENETLLCPVKDNHDYSSSLIILDFFLLKEHFPEVILFEKGYGT